MKLSIVIPFYNEENMIQKMYDALVAEINKITKAEFEIIFINDGSKDRTFEKMLAIADSDSRVKYISFSRNFGKEAGTIAGLEYATGEAVILMDGDLQHPPALLPQMIEAYEQGYDVVSARRTRTVGETKYSLKFSLNYAIQGILSFNDKPLRMCINFGLFCLLISLAYVLWTFVQYFVAPDSLVSGYFTTIFSVVLFGGIQLISIGVLGEYIGKIYYEVKKRPHYLVDETNMTVKGEQHDD